MAVVITYVEETVGELVTWLHEKDEYFEILMDSVYGMHMGDEEDDTYNGYDTFANDDNGRNGVGGWEGPSPKTSSGLIFFFASWCPYLHNNLFWEKP